MIFFPALLAGIGLIILAVIMIFFVGPLSRALAPIRENTPLAGEKDPIKGARVRVQITIIAMVLIGIALVVASFLNLEW